MSSQFNIKNAASICRQGGVIAYPTESVYGLGCDPLNQLAVFRLLYLKQRPVEKGLILLASDIQQLLPFITPNASQLKKLTTIPDKPTTWLVPASSLAPDWITGRHKKLAVRITQHKTARALCDALGFPLVSTSANRDSRPPAKTALKVKQYFGNEIDFILAGATGKLDKPTEIKDLDTNQIIRPG
ncbi:MAG: Sua5/YciO/YrdC/YwlC family protein [Gammaproteobacteria bacterium]|nr:Sua5/YciO/YrdC/YwlC family protein [Gammaproteobacteria bacterium]